MAGAKEIKRYFTSYSGLMLPLKLVGEITLEELENRNTYFEAVYDSENRLRECSKIVYGENEMKHEYKYRNNGSLEEAVISNMGEDAQRLVFDEDGKRHIN